LDVFCETEKERPDLEVLYLSVSHFSALKNPRHVFAETTRSKWLEKYLVRSVDRGPPFAASLFEFQPSTTPARRANILGVPVESEIIAGRSLTWQIILWAGFVMQGEWR